MGGRGTPARLVDSGVADGGENLSALNGRHIGGAVFRCEVGRPGEKGLKVCTVGENAIRTVCIILFVLEKKIFFLNIFLSMICFNTYKSALNYLFFLISYIYLL